MAQQKTRLKRFTPIQRLFHMLLMLSFLVQAATGLGRMYIETSWGKGIVWVFGGYEATRAFHIYVGLFMMAGFLAHIGYLLVRLDWSHLWASLSGPDSLVPRPRDASDFFKHLGWMIGARPAPRFDRWGYWEKFDYWAVFWGIPILGITGLMLAYPLASSDLLPGYSLNVAFWIHRIEAILAMAHVFIIHFFIAHLRPHSFPMDRAMLEGSVDLHSAREEKGEWVERLEKSGKLKPALIEGPPPPGKMAIAYAIGYAAVLVGVFLLIGGLVNARYITW